MPDIHASNLASLLPTRQSMSIGWIKKHTLVHCQWAYPPIVYEYRKEETNKRYR